MDNKVATRDEVIRQLSTMLRKKDALQDDIFIKLLTSYGRLQGWFK
jgi:hypothetical protein